VPRCCHIAGDANIDRCTCCRRQSAEEKELQRLQASLPCQPLKPDDDVAATRQVSPSSSSFTQSSLEALQRLQPWSDDVTGSSRPFTLV